MRMRKGITQLNGGSGADESIIYSGNWKSYGGLWAIK